MILVYATFGATGASAQDFESASRPSETLDETNEHARVGVEGTKKAEAAKEKDLIKKRGYTIKGISVGVVGALAYGAGLIVAYQCSLEHDQCLPAWGGALLIPPVLMALTGLALGDPQKGVLAGVGTLVLAPLIGLAASGMVTPIVVSAFLFGDLSRQQLAALAGGVVGIGVIAGIGSAVAISKSVFENRKSDVE